MPACEPPPIRTLFNPQSIAIIGASTSAGKIGYKVIDNIIAGGYEGKIYPVNPKGGEILGLPIYSSIHDLPETPDVAVIIVPAMRVAEAASHCGERGVQYLTVISSGFSEVGELDRERELVSLAHEYGMRILGPNIFGHYSHGVNLNASFGPRDIKPGSVAIITQSGALGVAMIGKTAIQNIGLSAIISVGNKSDLDESDLLEYLVTDDLTRVILMYIEGIHDGHRLITQLRKATRIKPVIVIKSGRSRRGAIAAASHTGSLAGSDEIFSAIMDQVGVLRAENVQEALDWSRVFSQTPLPQGPGTVIITNGGGVGVLATDACEKYHVHLYEDFSRLREIFQDVVHGFGSTKNPVDLTGEATEEDYRKALLRALEDDKIHSVIALYCETAMMSAERLSRMIASIYSEYMKQNMPIIFAMFGGEKTEQSIDLLTQRNIPVFGEVYQAVSSLGAIYHFFHTVNRPVQSFVKKKSNHVIESIISHARREDRTFLLANEGQAVLDEVGIPRPQSAVLSSLPEAIRVAETMGYPIVMKVVSEDILHKSDVGGVLLNINHSEDVANGWQIIMRKCKSHRPNAVIQGIELSEQIAPGTEVIIGVRKDPTFGPIIMFGLGGIYVEVMKDVVFRALPVSDETLYAMIKHVRAYALLLGVRGQKRKDIPAIVSAMKRIITIFNADPRISDIEINPLVVYDEGQGVKAVDVRIVLNEEGVK